jgi:endonuclease III
MEQRSLPQAKASASNRGSGAKKATPAKSKRGSAGHAKKGAASPKPAAPRAKTKGKSSQSEEIPFRAVSPSVAATLMKRLCDLYPDADCELDFESPFQLLVATILSAQTTDVQVNKVTKHLFKRFPNAKTLAQANLDDVKEIIKPTGYYNAKAQNIQACAQALMAKFNGEVPKCLTDLVTLPGVGRKTANVVLGEAFDIPGWTVDTHVQRLSRRLGFTGETDPYKIELALQKLFPEKDWSRFSITLIWHGRRLCFARNPACEKCPVNTLCPSSLV